MKNATQIIANYLTSLRSCPAFGPTECAVKLEELLSQAGYEITRSTAPEGLEAVEALKVVAAKVNGKIREGYSGRGMFGSTCYGIVCSDVNECIAQAGKFGIIGAKRDSMGMDYIVYFPDITEDTEAA